MIQKNYMKSSLKLLENKKIINLNAPEYVMLPLLIDGQKPKLLVEVEHDIEIGQPIAVLDANNKIASPISGKVKTIEEHKQADGTYCMVVKIENNFKQAEILPTLKNPSAEELNQRVIEAGMYELSCFHREHKITLNTLDYKSTLKVNELVLNNFFGQVLKGANLIKKALDLNVVEVAVNAENFDKVNKMVNKYNLKNLQVIKVKKANRVKGPTIDCQTALNFYEAVSFGQIPTDRIVAVSGLSIKKPGYYLIKIGTSLDEAMKLLGGLKYSYKEIEDFKDQAKMALNDEVQIKKEIKQEEDLEKRQELTDLLHEKQAEAKEKIYKYFKENQEKYKLCLANMMMSEKDKLYSVGSITNSISNKTSSVLFLSNSQYKKKQKNK